MIQISENIQPNQTNIKNKCEETIYVASVIPTYIDNTPNKWNATFCICDKSDFYIPLFCHYCIIVEQINFLCCHKDNSPIFGRLFVCGGFLFDIITNTCLFTICTTIILRNMIITKYNIDACYNNICSGFCCCCALWQQQHILARDSDPTRHAIISLPIMT
jgi:hypothetical protein